MPLGGSNEPDLKELLKEAQRAVITDLTDKAKSGQITHQELAILHKMLRDAGLSVMDDSTEEQERVRQKNAAGLPEFDDE